MNVIVYNNTIPFIFKYNHVCYRIIPDIAIDKMFRGKWISLLKTENVTAEDADAFIAFVAYREERTK